MGPTGPANESAELKKEERWDELTYDVRIERLRNALQRALQQIEAQSSIINDLSYKLSAHQHDDGGSIYIKKYINPGGMEVDNTVHRGLMETARAVGSISRQYGLE